MSVVILYYMHWIGAEKKPSHMTDAELFLWKKHCEEVMDSPNEDYKTLQAMLLLVGEIERRERLKENG